MDIARPKPTGVAPSMRTPAAPEKLVEGSSGIPVTAGTLPVTEPPHESQEPMFSAEQKSNNAVQTPPSRPAETTDASLRQIIIISIAVMLLLGGITIAVYLKS